MILELAVYSISCVSSVYIRFYTLDGEWSETIYIPVQPLSFTGFAVYLK